MKAMLLKHYLAFPPGHIVDFPLPVLTLLIRRGIAKAIDDPDGDGKAEGGKEGEKKAFSRPPQGKHKK